ncbi:MAG: response regulator [Candidatus Omnitrophica bacterium]|nr:response regulator [Candidatus Omnitrophota bacterium]
MPRNIIIVDDEPDLVKFSSYRLKYAGYDVVSASDAETALEMMRSNVPDLVFLDVHLPGMSGYDLCKIIKNDEALKKICVIFFSATSQLDEIEQKIKELNAQGYVRKPFEPHELLDAAKKCL